MPDREAPAESGNLEDELVALRALHDRVAPLESEWQPPPAGLWARIAAEAGVATGPDEAGQGAMTAEPEDRDGHGATGAKVSGLDLHRKARRGGAPGRGRMTQRWSPLAIAAAIIAVPLAGTLLLTLGRGGDGDTVVVASEALAPLEDVGVGEAELVEHEGALELRVNLSGIDPEDGFLEVWMIDTEVAGMVSLGPVRSDGVYRLPEGMDPGAFPIVDISREPFDGNPTHSGVSVLRAQLQL